MKKLLCVFAMLGCLAGAEGARGYRVAAEFSGEELGSARPMVVTRSGQAAEIHIYRNTIVGPAQVRNVDSADGPFRFRNNVIVNSNSGTPAGSHISQVSVSDTSRIIVTDQLTGLPSAGIVDSNGSLTPSYERYVGTHGHQLGQNPVAPMPPRR